MTRQYANAHDYNVKVNDIFTGSWGYDQTNREYWRVLSISKSGKSITLRKLANITQDDGWHAKPGDDYVHNQWRVRDPNTPAVCNRCGSTADTAGHQRLGADLNILVCVGCGNQWDSRYEVFKGPKDKLCRTQVYSWREDKPQISLKLYDFCSLSPWDGKPGYETHYAFGH